MNASISLVNSSKLEIPKYPSTSELINKLWYIHTMETHYWYIQQYGWILHYAKWKMPDTKAYILFDSI